MIIMTLEGIGISFGDTVLLQNVTQGIEDYDRIGVIGINGTGKSTLLAIIAGALQPDEGKIISRNGLKISYLPQNPVFDAKHSVLENVVQNISQDQEFWNVQGEAAATLLKLGIEDPSVMPDTLSGGQRKRAALAAALLTPADILILDEPTNHLDHEMIEWLQEQLAGYKGALLMITHDRYFLDRVVNRIFSFEGDGHLHQSEGGYEEYLARKEGLDLEESSGNAGAVPAPEPPKKSKKYRAPEPRKRLTFSQQREYDTIEGVIDELTEKSQKLEEEMAQVTTDYVRLQQLSEEKQAIDAELEEKLERYIELQELVESFQ